jgi:hypothetical protein
MCDYSVEHSDDKKQMITGQYAAGSDRDIIQGTISISAWKAVSTVCYKLSFVYAHF